MTSRMPLPGAGRAAALNAASAPAMPEAPPPDAGGITCPNCGCPLTLEKTETANDATLGETPAPETYGK